MATDKYDGKNIIHKSALLHAIGQLVDINPDGFCVSQIAGFMNRSKPTAKRHLDQLVKDKKLITIKCDETAMGKHYYGMTDEMKEMYVSQAFRFEYEIYVQKVLKVILQ